LLYRTPSDIFGEAYGKAAAKKMQMKMMMSDEIRVHVIRLE
jgi:hypothetical protein